MQTRYGELREQAIAFHRKYPQVWKLFCMFALERVDRGFQHYGAKTIMERVRWETAVPGDEGEFKINNNFTSFYARAFMKQYPEHEGFFRIRTQISAYIPASDMPPLRPEYFDTR